mgnify:CR=1 FL=1
MNYSIIFYIIGWILNLEAAFMLPSCLVALIYQENSGWSLVAAVLLCLLIGLPLVIRKPKNRVFYLREGFATTALCWIVLSCVGALPFVLSGYIPNPVDALFETVSGFTTTGASILTDVEALPHCLLFWRSFTHWIGGMGVLVFLLAVIPLSGGSHMNLMKAESPGPSVTRLVPKVKSTAKILYMIYIVLTIIEIFLLLFGGMPLFDSITLSLGTAGPGGFGIKNDSIAGYSTYCQVIITIFMILFGINFNAYFLILIRKFRQAWESEEVRAYLLIIAAATLAITFNVRGYFSSFAQAFQQTIFQVASIITTTGYATTNFDLWPEFSKGILVLLMFCGACAGSTGGGFKISRLLILCKAIPKQLSLVIHPREVKVIRMDGKPIDHNTLRSTNVYLAIYFFILLVSTLLISVDNFNLTTNFTAVASTLNNIGPGLDGVGPTRNFGMYSDFSKFVLMFDMLAGRLELYPLLILFMPSLWRRK